MNNVRNWSLTVAVAGFLFGFDTVVISGANLPIKELWHTTPLFHGIFIMSMALWGTVFGALFGGIPCDKLGRKKTLFWIGILFLVSALGSALAPDPYTFSFFRFIGGIGVGASSVAAPIYISEISSAKNRGKLVALFQFNIVFGILIAFFSNYLFEGFGGVNDWRWMIGIVAVPAFIYSIIVLQIPDSPRWLILKKRDDVAGLKVLEMIYEKEEALESFNEIKKDVIDASVKETIFSNKYKLPVILAFLLAFFNQLSGINFILYYAPEILEMAGLASKESLLNSILIGLTNLIFTIVGMRLIDVLGRKQLMIIGSIGYIVSLGMVALAFHNNLGAIILMVSILLFIASHAIGQGAVIWVFISEIFPNNVRANGQSFGTGIHWIFAALITLAGPVVIDLFKENPWPIFAFFAFMMVLQLVFVLFMMPETKGLSLEELEHKMLNHE
ncbi:sugar porter family MFS transporter [Flavobacterium gawalongense]|uniref:Sugar porter family MFS transporter n=1 Tax=Flavobacterium gawalongense TaxID=2594432 RepID=A0A553BXD5_9FLAO|nr:sugar porter family MFS transporter [Flavobacterium gawalongense]TRX04207.1 sugar porter family MFS transporter [Flavobacterium gawalongense]TRX09343.1 sugar porter family MFS transporter [Flavobacterium gawalongense]TRX12843.1 sugar porter family MFS transporter [Flavobacterium gawalongense]TRX13188.1 sugar porter family MFS transporter [Flavobacterium gawalongense]TRX30750.1 sugar porter family MFS transporter [Flavobacterium gawalongense]